MKKIIITGNTGFTGYWLSSWLSLEGFSVVGFSDRPAGVSNLFDQQDLDKKIITQFGDIVEGQSFFSLCQSFSPDLIIHLAAQPLVLEGYKNPLATFKTNVTGTINVLDAALKQDSVKGLLIVTSDKVYKTQNSKTSFTETDPLGGIDPYSASKSAADIIASSYRRLLNDSNKICTVVRGGNIIGGGDFSPNRLIPDLVRAWTNGSPIFVREPNAVRPWQHVLDLVSGYVSCTELILSGNWKSNQNFNIGPSISEQGKSVVDLVNEFRIHGISVSAELGQSTGRESDYLSISSTLANESLGWQPMLKFASAVELSAQWYRDFFMQKKSAENLVAEQLIRYRSLIA